MLAPHKEFRDWLNFYTKMAVYVEQNKLPSDYRFSFTADDDMPTRSSNSESPTPTQSTYNYSMSILRENAIEETHAYLIDKSETILWFLDGCETNDKWEREQIEKLKEFFFNFVL